MNFVSIKLTPEDKYFLQCTVENKTIQFEQ